MTDEEMLAYYLRQPPPKRRIGFVGWCVRAVEWALLIICGLFVWFYILPLVGAALTGEQPTAPPAQALKKPADAPYRTTNTGGGGGYTSAPRSPLPPCSSVTDTTTACQQDASAAAVEELPTQAPEPTATPPYLAPCQTAPGERPCWLPAEAEWQPLETVPETPVVLVPEPTSVPLVFSDSACAAWRPPLPWPEGCDAND